MRAHRSGVRGAARGARIPLLVLVALAACVLPAAPARALAPIWTATVPGDGSAYDAATGLAVSADGSLYSCGYIYHDATGDDATITRWDDAPAGWARVWDGAAHRADTAADMTVTATGRIYVTGVTQNAAGDNDILLLRYSTAGTLQWARSWKGAGASWEAGLKVAVDKVGNIFVAGGRRATATTGRVQMVLLKYGTTGTLLWARIYARADANVTLHDLCLDSLGNAYLVGDTSLGKLNGAIVSYSSAGVQRWVRFYDDPAHARDSFSAVCAAPTGGVYVAGVAGAGLGASDGLVMRYTSAGTASVLKLFGLGDAKRQWLNDIAVDARGRIAICGSWQAAEPDTYAAMLTGAGAVVWSRRIPGPYANTDEAKVLTIDSLNRPCIASELQVDPDVAQWATYAFSALGALRWSSLWPDPATGPMAVRDIASWGASNVWVCGSGYGGAATGGDQLFLGWPLL